MKREHSSKTIGLEFDQAFVREAIQHHVRDLAVFEKEDQSSASDADIKGFAHSTHPKLRSHLE